MVAREPGKLCLQFFVQNLMREEVCESEKQVNILLGQHDHVNGSYKLRIFLCGLSSIFNSVLVTVPETSIEHCYWETDKRDGSYRHIKVIG